MQLPATGWTARVQFPAEAREFSLVHSVQAGSAAYPAFYRIGPEGSFPGIKRPRREADYSLPSAEVKNGGAIPPLTYRLSWGGA
jgi:hypothetical protein